MAYKCRHYYCDKTAKSSFGLSYPAITFIFLVEAFIESDVQGQSIPGVNKGEGFTQGPIDKITQPTTVFKPATFQSDTQRATHHPKNMSMQNGPMPN